MWNWSLNKCNQFITFSANDLNFGNKSQYKLTEENTVSENAFWYFSEHDFNSIIKWGQKSFLGQKYWWNQRKAQSFRIFPSNNGSSFSGFCLCRIFFIYFSNAIFNWIKMTSNLVESTQPSHEFCIEFLYLAQKLFMNKKY